MFKLIYGMFDRARWSFSTKFTEKTSNYKRSDSIDIHNIDEKDEYSSVAVINQPRSVVKLQSWLQMANCSSAIPEYNGCATKNLSKNVIKNSNSVGSSLSTRRSLKNRHVPSRTKSADELCQRNQHCHKSRDLSHSPIRQRRSKHVLRSRSRTQRSTRTSASDDCESIYSTRFDRLSTTLVKYRPNENIPPDCLPHRSSKSKQYSFHTHHRHHIDTSSMKDSGYSDSQTSVQQLKRKSPNDPSYYAYNINPQVEIAKLQPSCHCQYHHHHCCCCQCHSSTLNHTEKQTISSLNNRNRTRRPLFMRNQMCLTMLENNMTTPLSFDIKSVDLENINKSCYKRPLKLRPLKQSSSSSSYASSPQLPEFEPSFDSSHFSSSSDNPYYSSSSKSDNFRQQIKKHTIASEHLSTSRSYPHIKPLPKTPSSKENAINNENNRRRKRHLSCDSSVWHSYQQQSLSTELLSSHKSRTSARRHRPLQRHLTTIGIIADNDQLSFIKNDTNLSNSDVFGELNLAAIELDSLRTADQSDADDDDNNNNHILVSSPVPFPKTRSMQRTFLVWNNYSNQQFSVSRGDQVKLLKKVGKDTLFVQKDDTNEVGFIPKNCLAHEINTFLSVKGLKETVL